MQKSEIHIKLHYILALLIAFSLPFAKLTPIFIGLLFANWLIEGNLKNKFQSIFKNKFALLFISLYIIHLVGLIYTTNISSGLFDIEVKFSMLIFPIIIASKPYNKKQISDIFTAFTIGVLYSTFYLLSRSFSIYIMNGENAFFYQSFSSLLHPSYISMYINIVIIWLLYNIINRNENQKQPSIYIHILIIIYLSFIVVLVASKSGILSIFLIIFCFILYQLIYQKKYLIGILGILGIFFAVLLGNYFAPKVVSRIHYFTESLTSNNSSESNESTAVRMLIWKSSNQIIKQNFLIGVGTGDAKDCLKNEYNKAKVTNALSHSLNAHNEFYQIFICLGIIGFALLLTNILMPVFYYLKRNNYLYLFFLLLISFNFISESMLETQAGVMFYAFFNSLLCFEKSMSNNK